MADKETKMKKSTKRLWAARLLALVVMSFGLSLLASMAAENRQAYKRRVEIRANENIGQIVSAVEELGRDDINIQTKDESLFVRRLGFLQGAGALFVAFGIFLAIYHTIYCVINGLLDLMKEDDSQLEGRLTDDLIEPSR